MHKQGFTQNMTRHVRLWVLPGTPRGALGVRGGGSPMSEG